jgi:hypothetical protein
MMQRFQETPMIHRKWLTFCLPLLSVLLAAPSASAAPICTTLTTGSASVGDVLISNAAPTTNYGADTSGLTGVGHHNTVDYTLMHLDVSFIPAGSIVNSATVTLQQLSCSTPGTLVDVYQVLGGWNPTTVTWSDFTAGFSANPVATYLSGVGAVSFDLTAVTQAWVNGTAGNYGILLSQSTGQTGYDFSVSENLQILSVCYTPTANPSLSLLKTLSTSGVCPGNASATVAPGAQVTDCYAVTNTGNVTITGVVVNDNGTAVSIGTLAPGAKGSGSTTAAATMNSDSQAVATGLAGNTLVTSSPSAAQVTLLTSSLSLKKTVSPGSACPGSSSVSITNGLPVTFCYVVYNTGGLAINGVVVNDGGVTVNIGNLAAGASGTGSSTTLALANSDSPAVASGTDTTGAAVSSPQSVASVNVVSMTLGLDPTCQGNGNFESVSNAGFPDHESATCASGDAVTLSDIVAYCGTNVQSFGYVCTDFPAAPPGQLDNERTWTAGFECCVAPGGPTCSDGIMDGTETDVDCGGQCPLTCLVGQSCVYDTDCMSDYCHGNLCATPSVLDSTCINDGVNATIYNVGWPYHEDGTCGGGFEGFTIDQAAALCPGGVVKYFDYGCTDFPLPPPYTPQRSWTSDYSCCDPTCHDGLLDGTETDVDCGGQCPLACLPGQRCNCDSDCQQDYCVDGICVTPPVLESNCTNDGTNASLQNPGWPYHEVGTCDQCFEGWSIFQAAAECPGGVVKYFDYGCTDFPAAPPYQPYPERAWTSDWSCCVPGTGTPP